MLLCDVLQILAAVWHVITFSICLPFRWQKHSAYICIGWETSSAYCEEKKVIPFLSSI